MSGAKIPIIVTRAEPGASETADGLNTLGYDTLCVPALSLDQISDAPLPSASEVSGLVFTSANGVRAYASRRTDRHLTAWCVGPATAMAARHAGFASVRESAGNAMDLAQYISANTDPADTPLLHIANAAAAGTLKRELERLGFSVTFAALYRMLPRPSLPQDILELLTQSDPVIILIHSAKGAEALANLLEAGSLKSCTLVAISEPASAPLAEFAREQTYIAEAPNEDALLRAVKQAVATLSA